MRNRMLALTAGLALFATSGVAAQESAGCFGNGCTASVTLGASITIPQVLFISTTVSNIAFGAVTDAEFEAGEITGTAFDLRHAGNVAHDVTVEGSAAFLDATNAANDNTKPVGDLVFDVGGGDVATGAPGSPATLINAAARGSTTVSVSPKMLLDYATDAPDTYTVDVTFTIVAD